MQSRGTPALGLSAVEQEILALWNQTQELDLERAMLEAEAQVTNEQSTTIQEDLAQAQTDLLKSRAKFTLRNKITHQVLITNPILKAVHDSPSASILDQKLTPFITQRDILSLRLTNLQSELQDLNSNSLTKQDAILSSDQQNAKLAAEMLKLAEDLKREEAATAEIDGPLNAQIAELDQKIKDGNREVIMLRRTLAGLLVASGIDWVRADEGKWVKFVMDDENRSQSYTATGC